MVLISRYPEMDSGSAFSSALAESPQSWILALHLESSCPSSFFPTPHLIIFLKDLVPVLFYSSLFSGLVPTSCYIRKSPKDIFNKKKTVTSTANASHAWSAGLRLELPLILNTPSKFFLQFFLPLLGSRSRLGTSTLDSGPSGHLIYSGVNGILHSCVKKKSS